MVARRRCHDQQLIVFYQAADGFLAAAHGLLPLVGQRVETDIDDGALALLLPVVEPANDGQHRVHEAVVVHAVLAVEADGPRIVLVKQVEGVNGGVFVAEEPNDTVQLLVFVHAAEALLGHLLILFHQGFRHDEILHAVLPRVLKVLCPHHVVAHHRVAHLQGRVDDDAVVAVEHLGVHAAHRSADDQVGVLGLAGGAQQLHGLCGVDGQVGGNDRCRGQCRAYAGHRSRLSRRGETVDVKNLLARHQVGELFDIRVFHDCKNKHFSRFISIFE